jgi:hypothetical protein
MKVGHFNTRLFGSRSYRYISSIGRYSHRITHRIRLTSRRGDCREFVSASSVCRLKLHPSEEFFTEQLSQSTKIISSRETIYVDDVLSLQDFSIGILVALTLAFLLSYLNGLSTSSSFISSRNQIVPEYNDDNIIEKEKINEPKSTTKNKQFEAKDWIEISQPENYILFATRVKRQIDFKKGISSEGSQYEEAFQTKSKGSNKSNTYGSLFGLLLLFVPLFSFEFFFALSRQFLCGDGAGPSLSMFSMTADWSHRLCSAYVPQ